MQLQTINEKWLSTKTQDVIPKHNLPHTVCLEIRPITETITVKSISAIFFWYLGNVSR